MRSAPHVSCGCRMIALLTCVEGLVTGLPRAYSDRQMIDPPPRDLSLSVDGLRVDVLEAGRARHPGSWVSPESAVDEWLWSPINVVLVRGGGGMTLIDAGAGSLGTWWPHKGTSEWVQVTYATPRTITGARVWWFDDSERGGNCATPASWRLEYRDGESWKPCDLLPSDTYSTKPAASNTVRVKPITTTAVRVMATLRQGRSAGISELTIDSRRPSETRP